MFFRSLGSGLNLYAVPPLANGYYKKFPDTLYFNDCMILACYNGGIGHVNDARRLARVNGEDPNSWEVVLRYLELKADPAYYQHEVVKCGKFTGYRQTRAFVQDVMNRYNKYCRITQL